MIPIPWAEAIDALEAGAAAVEAVLADPLADGADVPRFVPPDDLGPMPQALRNRADAVLRRLRVAEDEIRARRDLLNQELTLVSGATRPPVARYLDTRA